MKIDIKYEHHPHRKQKYLRWVASSWFKHEDRKHFKCHHAKTRADATEGLIIRVKEIVCVAKSTGTAEICCDD